MTNKNKIFQLKEWDKKYIWHPFTQMQDWKKEEPLVIASGKGIYLKDLEGRRYIDGVSSLWVNVHGHNDKELNGAIIKQLKKIAHSTLLGLGNVPSIELAKMLIGIAPRGLTRVFYSDSGSTAVEIALKIGYQYWQHVERGSKRIKFMTFREGYHGDTIGAVSAGGIDLFHEKYRPLLFDVVRMPSPYFYRDKMGELLSMMEEEVKNRPKEFIGIVMEPLIQAAAGMLIHPKGFLKAVREFCDRHQLLLIVDEVATGFGRTGKMFACEHERVTPDLMTVAKGITGGYLPLAATLANDRIYQAFLGEYSEFKTFFHGHTYTGNPLACAVAIESLKLFGKSQLMKKIQKNILTLKSELKRFMKHPHVYEIRQCGMMVGIELVRRKAPKEEYPLTEKTGIRVCQEVRKNGVILRPLGNVIVLMPPLSIRERELKRLIDVTHQCINDICGTD